MLCNTTPLSVSILMPETSKKLEPVGAMMAGAGLGWPEEQEELRIYIYFPAKVHKALQNNSRNS
ncbi:hypothetical protein GCM10028895_27430 [Pontibacter rugosus]